MLTLFLLLGHDGVAQSQQAEEGLSLPVPLPHRLQQIVVVKDELRISQLVPGEVHCLCLLNKKKVKQKSWSYTYFTPN